jgi:hypothetical protein
MTLVVGGCQHPAAMCSLEIRRSHCESRFFIAFESVIVKNAVSLFSAKTYMRDIQTNISISIKRRITYVGISRKNMQWQVHCCEDS